MMGNNLKTLMREQKVNVWELADHFDVSHLTLLCVMDGSTAGTELRRRITAKMLDLGLCPECGSHTIPAGSCVHCLCGWELCS